MTETTQEAGTPEPENHTIPDLKPEEFQKLVSGLVGGSVFTDRHIPDADKRMLGSVFMPIALGGFRGWKEEELNRIGCIYEYLDRAGPRSVNGYPMFYSCHLVNKDQWAKVIAAYNQAKDVITGAPA